MDLKKLLSKGMDKDKSEAKDSLIEETVKKSY